MKYIDINGNKMPVLGFGTWQLEGGACVEAVESALEIGYRHIDTAQIYGNEAEVGRAIAKNVKRDELFLTTKIWIHNYSARMVAATFAESLDKLGTDYVDLLLMHWPNPDADLKETLNAMQLLVEQKKVRAIGVSNFPVKWMEKVVEKLKVNIVCNQVEYHAMLSQDAVIKYARAHNIAVTAYSPLGRGLLLSDKTLINIGDKYGKTAGQVALRWLIEQDGVAAIPKAASIKNAKLNFDIFDFELSADDKAAIAKLPKDKRTINPAFAPKWDK